MTTRRNLLKSFMLVAAATATLGTVSNQAVAATAEDLDKDAVQALQTLYKTNPTAEALSKKALAGRR